MKSTKMILKNKTAIITGGSGGLGSAIAAHYAQLGANIILIARDLGRLEQCADKIESIYQDIGLNDGQVTLISADLSDFNQVIKLCDNLRAKFNTIDIMVCAHALIYQLSPLNHISTQDWYKIFNTNLHANFMLLKHLHPLLSASNHGRVIMVTDKTSDEATPFWGAYSASQTALVNMAQIYAKEQADISNIKINIVQIQNELDTKLRHKVSPGGKSENIISPSKIVDIFGKLVIDDLSDNGKIYKAAA